MTLSEYLKKKNLKATEFSAICGISQAAIYTYLKGKRPTLAMANAIYIATKGAVTVEELRGGR